MCCKVLRDAAARAGAVEKLVLGSMTGGAERESWNGMTALEVMTRILVCAGQ
jgi:hypothetical protein